MKLTLSLDGFSRGLQRTFAALQFRNYRLWFFGQLISLAGTWMQSAAQGYLVYELTKSPAVLGYVGFASGLPAWLFTVYGGVAADRLPRRSVLLVTQSAMMALAFLLAGLVFTKTVQPWHILVISFGVGVANALDSPARLAIVADLVDREEMTNAIALNALMFNLATVVGPALAGVVYAALGPGWSFALNGVSYLAVIGALLLMRLPNRRPTPSGERVAEQLREGFRYTIQSPVIRTVVINIGVLSLFGMSLLVLLPAWAVDVLGGDVRTNGFLLASRGVGALVGALMIAYLGQRVVRGRLWTAGTLLLPPALTVFALWHWAPAALATLVLVGWSFIVVANISNALIQTSVPDHLRGRVLSIYTMVFFGSMPLGALWIGQLAERVSEPAAVLANAAILGASALLLLWRAPFMRRLA
ncbi:MAG: MFS transporter [Caldilineales bacterium]|nr:MFS transporter [Caldilineales bacterium]MDW8319215.1 MFS transporter [Anaerolineae bacterium]